MFAPAKTSYCVRNWVFPDCNSSWNSPMATKCNNYSSDVHAKSMSSVKFQGHTCPKTEKNPLKLIPPLVSRQCRLIHICFYFPNATQIFESVAAPIEASLVFWTTVPTAVNYIDVIALIKCTKAPPIYIRYLYEDSFCKWSLAGL